MGICIETIHGRVTNPGATITAVAADTGDSFAVRNFDSPGSAQLCQIWASCATAGVARVRSPRMHDNVQGYRFRVAAADSNPLMPFGYNQGLYAQDTLIPELSGGGAETDTMALLIYYSDLPGSNARIVDWQSIKNRVRNIITIETAHSTGATLGDYGSSIALNAGVADLLKANLDYAIIGYGVDSRVTSVGWRGPDLSGFRLAAPGTTLRSYTEQWFIDQNLYSGLPFIPIINSANKAGTFVDLVHNLGAVTVNVNTILAELAP